MKRALIKDKDDVIFLYLNEDNSFSGSKFYADGRVEPIDYSVFKYFEIFRLSNNYTILPQTGKYLVVLDNETNFRHFFLDGVENYEMFFYNNGESAIDFATKDDEKKEVKKSNARKFYTRYITFVIALEMIVLPLVFRPYINKYNYAHTEYENFTVKKIFRMIDDSKSLPIGCKKVLKQSEFFKTFLPYINASNLEKGNLNDCLNDLYIRFFSSDEMQNRKILSDWSNVTGFHSDYESNKIGIIKKLDLKDFIDTLCHEFIHVCQCPLLDYNALYEAMAEQLSYEFFPTSINSFKKEVSQLRKMMDLIGSEPFMVYYATGNMDLIEKGFKPYLGEEGYKDFLSKLNKVQIPNKIFPWHDYYVKKEEKRKQDLDVILDDLAKKMGKEFIDNDVDDSPVPKHFYFNKHPYLRNLLAGCSHNLKEAYDNGIIGFALVDEDGIFYRTLDYDEAVSRYEKLDEDSDDIVVTYNPDGESTWTWAGASIDKHDGEYIVVPYLNPGDTKEYYLEFCENSNDDDIDSAFYVDYETIENNREKANERISNESKMRNLLEKKEAQEKYEKQDSNTTVFWKNSNQLEITINGSTVIIDPNLALQVFGNNDEVKYRVSKLLNSTEKKIRDKLNEPIESFNLSTMISENPIELEHNVDGDSKTTINSIYSVFMNKFAQYVEYSSENDVEEFMRRYNSLRVELENDSDYENEALKADIDEGLKAEDIYRKNIARTQIDKKGSSFIFMNRLQKEADECEIENYFLCEKKGNELKWYLLCADDDEYYICDPEKDFGASRDEEANWGHIPLVDFLSYQSKDGENDASYYVTEWFKDNSKSLDELKAFSLSDFMNARDLYRSSPYVVLSDENMAIIHGNVEAPVR